MGAHKQGVECVPIEILPQIPAFKVGVCTPDWNHDYIRIVANALKGDSYFRSF
jgi:hypothetical protein